MEKRRGDDLERVQEVGGSKVAMGRQNDIMRKNTK